MSIDRVPVLIVGAGPTGLVAANLLGLSGIQTRIIEQNPGLSSFPRAIAIDDEGLRICQALGLSQEVLQHVRLNVGATYLSGQRLLVHVAPHKQRNGYPLISTFDQPGLETALLHGLQRFSEVEVCFGQSLESFTLTAEGVLVTLRTADGELEQIACSYLLACDGGRSTVRRQLGLSLRGRTFPQRWLVVDALRDDEISSGDITFFCNPERPAVSVPAPGQGWRWEFMLLPGEDEEWFLQSANLLPLIQQSSGQRAPRLLRQSIYTFHASCAPAFARGPIMLLGDAAHLLPPFGGQGMNCGLRDAHNLVWKLARVLRGQSQPELLASYEQERRPHALAMIRLSAFLGSVIMPTRFWQARLRDLIIRLAVSIPWIAPLLTEMRIKPASRYSRGLCLRGGSLWASRYAGLLLPQPMVQDQHGCSRPLDDLLGQNFTLLCYSDQPEGAFAALRSDIWKSLPAQFLCLLPEDLAQPPASEQVLYARDITGQYAHFLGGHRDWYVLVRPDRYILGIFHPKGEMVFVQRLQKRLAIY